ncbi:uncharacterized protein RAG0_04853 [Rhynchosporium agropyri]|uniref:Protein SQS1 n=1 Tax=Rhynchosporium agropyri TaxID=914238 RepID=A0A1E1KAE7_9HELO|nr:uncharacterized protein RAG0_04853 [Rhynchosporium agropyri]
MPRSKKAPRRGNFQASRGGRGGRQSNDTSFIPFSGTSSPRKAHGFTLQDEARNTDRGSAFWDKRLRDSKVSFVSAGKIVPTEPDETETETALAEMTLECPKTSVKETMADEEREQEEQSSAAEWHEATHEESASSFVKTSIHEGTFDFIVDTQGSGPVQTGLPPPTVYPASPTPSNSSEEVILFRGRGRDPSQHPGSSTKTSQLSRKIPKNIDAKIRVVEDRIHHQTELLQEVIADTRPSVSQPSTKNIHEADFESILPQKSRRRGRRADRRGQNKNDEQLEEDAIIADYIKNMDEDDPLFKSFNQRDLGGMEEDTWQDTEDSSGEPAAEPTRAGQVEWNRSDFEDFDDLGTSDAVVGEVQAILSKRERVSGIQYLVVWEDQSVDEARWVPVTSLTSFIAQMFIETFEAEERLIAEFQGDDEDTYDSDDSLEVDVEIEDDEDDADLIQRKIDSLNDERIARLLSKQEELGMGSDQILLFDEDEDDEGDFVKSSFGASAAKFTAPKSSRKSQRAKGDFPSAVLMADAYDGFNVMDFDRPSLKKKPKGRKGKLVLDDVSDSELEASMRAAWDNDREKKKERKQEREEVRSQGLLGGRSGKVDIKQKYKEGMGIYAIREEIKNFLIGGNTTLSLPPMDKTDRKVVHELANAFNLKSKSAGKGNNRFPILYRSTRTLSFDDATFAKADARISRRFLPRMDVNGKRDSGTKRAAGVGGFNRAAVSYRDGDVVGGSAPELAADNRGRAMLEKMGWSSGTALGALNNKGIMLPVTHIVKTTKAGLG